MEKRAHPRFKISKSIIGFFKQLSDNHIKIIDISLGGIGFLFDGDMSEIGRSTLFDIGTSQSFSKSNVPVLEAPILEIERVPIRTFFSSDIPNRYSIEFGKLEDHQKALLIDFLQNSVKK